ncbi:MAG: DUF4296 domain-containing protein [Bacteroidetes bacterium]|nr:DUF4296 domain-containing protein [Bacteroidota bacterium]
MRNCIVILIMAFMLSCVKNDKVPDYVIPKEDMVNIIRDIHLTDGMLTISDVRRDLARQDTINYYDAIFENYGYKRADFDTSIYYYSKEINTFDEIYKEVLNQLNEMETLLKEDDKKEEEQDEPKKDVGNS